MDEDDTVNIFVKVVRQDNKNKNDTYTKQDVPIFDDVNDDLKRIFDNQFQGRACASDRKRSFSFGLHWEQKSKNYELQ